MNRVAALLLMVLVGPCALIGQSVSPKAETPVAGAGGGTPGINLGNVQFNASTFTRQPIVLGSNCPVELRARPGGGGAVAYASDARNGKSQRLHLTFANGKSKEIVAVSVTVRGLSPWARIVPADRGSQDSHTFAKTVDLKLNVATGKNAEEDVALQSFASITRVDLESVEYADGTSWKASAMQSCHIVPDLFVLVGAR
jgi:hypothetical protein